MADVRISGHMRRDGINGRGLPSMSKRFEYVKMSTLSYALQLFSGYQNFPGKQVDSEEWYQ